MLEKAKGLAVDQVFLDIEDAVARVLECYETRCAEIPAAPAKADAQ